MELDIESPIESLFENNFLFIASSGGIVYKLDLLREAAIFKQMIPEEFGLLVDFSYQDKYLRCGYADHLTSDNNLPVRHYVLSREDGELLEE